MDWLIASARCDHGSLEPTSAPRRERLPLLGEAPPTPLPLGWDTGSSSQKSIQFWCEKLWEKKDNSNIIAFWDSGDDETITTTESKQSIKDRKQNLKISKKQSDKSDWKEWDEL